MKVVIFAGGYGTRLSEETSVRPKPLVEIGGMPILHHVMRIYAQYGHTEFIVLGGYKVEHIKKFFLDYQALAGDFTIDLATGEITRTSKNLPNWKVTVLDTGRDTMTGGRLKRAKEHIGNETFCLTYGDGVCDIDLAALEAAHKGSGAMATVTAVSPPGRFGVLGISSETSKVTGFREKDSADAGLINGGFFICEPNVFDLIEGDDTIWEQGPMRQLVEDNQLNAYHHQGFWQSMDTLRDKQVLEEAYAKGAPWLKG